MTDIKKVIAERDEALLQLEIITADRDFEKKMKAKARIQRDVQTAKAADLQQHLTAADERADVLEGLLLQTNELLYAIQGDPGAVPSSSIDAMRGEVFTALKPAEGGGDE